MTAPQPELQPRVLIVTSRFPYPPIGGDRLHVFHLARLLARAYRVQVIGLGEADADTVRSFVAATGVETARAIAHGRARALSGAAAALVGGTPLQVGYYRSAAWVAAVDEAVARADLIVCHLIRASDLWHGQRPIPAVLDMCDAISSNYTQVLHTASRLRPWTWVAAIEGPRVRRFEQRELGRFDLVVLHTAADAQLLSAPPERTLLLTQGVELERYAFVPPAQRRGQSLALIGKMDTYPNRSGALWFAREVLPQLPAPMRLKLIGDCPPGLRRSFLRLPRVEVTGRVPDIAAACADCFAAVAPLDVATGIQNKVLEYFAMGLPAVLSPSVARGLEANAQGVFVEADAPGDWVRALTQLAADPAGAGEMAVRARRYVEQHHDWDRLGARLVQSIGQLLAHRRA